MNKLKKRLRRQLLLELYLESPFTSYCELARRLKEKYDLKYSLGTLRADAVSAIDAYIAGHPEETLPLPANLTNTCADAGSGYDYAKGCGNEIAVEEFKDPAFINEDEPEEALAPVAEQRKARERVMKMHNKVYYYNETTDTYVFFLKSAPNPLIIEGDVYKALKKRYSNWTGAQSSIHQIAREFGIPSNWFNELKKILRWTHDSEPFTDEDLLTRSERSLVEELLEDKRRSLYQEFKKAEWDEIQADAKKWRHREATITDPMMAAIKNNWPKYDLDLNLNIKNTATRPFSVIFAPHDLHMGKAPYKLKGFNPEEEDRMILAYVKQLIEKFCRYGKPEKIYAVAGNDFFHVDNAQLTTTKGTPQAAQTVGNIYDVQLRAINIARAMWDMLMSIGVPVVTIIVPGNHDYVMSLGLGRLLEDRYRNDKNFSLVMDESLTQHVIYGDSMLSFNHGEKLPRSGAPRWLKIQGDVHNARCTMDTTGIKNFFYFTGHIHKKHMSMDENTGIIEIVVPSFSSTDSWHHQNGFEGNQRSLSAYVIEKKGGLGAVFFESMK